jgi:hypothetical protein
MLFGLRYSGRLTSPRGRRYSSSVVKRGDTTQRAGIQFARKKQILIFKGQKVLLGLDLTPREKRLLEALLKTYRHLETRIGESKAFVEKLYEESREA